MKRYEPGERVLVTKLMASEFVKPMEATILSADPRSRIYGYQVCLGDGVNRYVKDDWLAPAETVIEEVSDTPWE